MYEFIVVNEKIDLIISMPYLYAFQFCVIENRSIDYLSSINSIKVKLTIIKTHMNMFS